MASYASYEEVAGEAKDNDLSDLQAGGEELQQQV
jgi:hypothetical protein